MVLKKGFFDRDAEIVARGLLGKILIRKIEDKILKAKIVETEAYYGENDPASRACKNGDLRETMLMDAGTILIYGVHNNWLINFVTNKKDNAQAVLLRALEPLNFDGRLNGPGLLTSTLGINKRFHKKKVYNNGELWVESKRKEEKFQIQEAYRVGIRRDLPKKLRFYIKDNKFISKIQR